MLEFEVVGKLKSLLYERAEFLYEIEKEIAENNDDSEYDGGKLFIRIAEANDLKELGKLYVEYYGQDMSAEELVGEVFEIFVTQEYTTK
jgi:hypothetical protein